MRSIFSFNADWLYAPRELPYSASDDAFEPVTLPHANITLPLRNFDNQEYQFISTYRKRFTLPEPRQGRRVAIDFDGAMTASTVLINGATLGDHDGGYVPFSFDLTDHLREGENTIQVRLDSVERPDIPPNGHLVDYLTFGGIYRDVTLRFVEPTHISRLFARPQNVLTAPTLSVDVYLEGELHEAHMLSAVLKDPNGTLIAEASLDALPAPGGEHRATLEFGVVPGVQLWDLATPALYTVEVALYDGATRLDDVSTRIGFREAVFKNDGFYLNGRHVKLMGLNRHQTYPYIGAAAPARLQRKDADILKDELGVNIVRTSHYPQSPHFLNRCDEIGLLVFEEIPGWQFIGDSDWQALTMRDVRVMIERDRNHPAIILWGVRINESWDNEALYTATNALAHKLDPTRQTGGVRYFQESQFLEDVFTYNDFSDTVVDPVNLPHLITEFCGHRFSTKTSDQEERQIAHALFHARIHDKQMGHPTIAGAIGWCFFDYNTHREFGSGDRVCYHGVTDMFRLPKYAAYVYESQIDPAVRPVIRALTSWAAGDRSGGGFEPLYVCSNCEEVELHVGDELIQRVSPARDEFPHLPHPPFKFTQCGLRLEEGLMNNYHDLRVVGYVGGQAVAEQRIRANGIPGTLLLQPDDTELHADGADMTRLVFKVVDEYGNRLHYYNAIVTFTLEGPGELVGDNPFAVIGGQAAIYVRAGKAPGTLTIRATAARMAPAEVTITTR
ncbi:MAG: glycoside hydrolase family 2 protein [Chloroflexi bacterium]|nr:glycoside hydrolase family 2 protein [Chloroflexota bacterium]